MCAFVSAKVVVVIVTDYFVIKILAHLSVVAKIINKSYRQINDFTPTGTTTLIASS